MQKWLGILVNILIWLLPSGGTVAVVILAWLEQMPAYLIVLSAIAAIAFGFWGVNQIHASRERRKRGIANLNDQETEKTIRNWLDDPFFTFQRKVDPNSLFQFVVTDEPGRPVTISRPKLKPTHLELATAITLSNEHRKKYETLSLGGKQKIMHDLRIEMARYGISYNGIDTKLERVELVDIVLLDNSLTEFYFRQRVFFVIRAFVLYSEIIGQQLGLSGKQDSNKEDFQPE